MSNLSDTEIIKALKCCSCNKCTTDGCPLAGNRICMTLLTTYALDLINRLKAENERLEASIKEVNEYLSEGDFAKGIALVCKLVKKMG